MTVVVRALRVVLAMALVGSVFLQAVMVPVIVLDMDGSGTAVRAVVAVALVVGVGAIQVVAVCAWRLLTMLGRGTIVSRSAVRHLEVVAGAIIVDALLVLAFGVALAPGEAAPGLVLLAGGFATLVAGVALVALVLRMVVAGAVERGVVAPG